MMPSKGSRRLAVDGHTFRYRIRFADEDTIRLAVESEETPGCVLSVAVAFQDPWLHVQEGTRDEPLRPRWVRQIVEEARRRGWRPERKGPPFRARANQDGTLTLG